MKRRLLKGQIAVAPDILQAQKGDYFAVEEDIFKVVTLDYEDEFGLGIVIEIVPARKLRKLKDISIRPAEEVISDKRQISILKDVSKDVRSR